MSNYLKPQSPIRLNDNYIYPLTTADQVITSTGERLNSLFKKTIRESATLRATDWSETLPYTQTITLTESTDDYNVDVNIVYNDTDNTTLNKAAECLSYIKKNHKDITFYCLKNKPTIDIPIDITSTCRNTIATVEEGVKLNFDIKRYATEEELLADTPKENTIGIISDVEINGYRFSVIEPESVNEGEVWIKTGTESNTAFNIVDGVMIYPISVKQYVSGTWTDVTPKSYQNGEWVDLIYYIINGNYSRITNMTGFASAQWSVSDNGLHITRNSSGSQSSWGITADAFDFTGKNKLVIELTSTNKELWISPCNINEDSRIATIKMKTNGIHELDISAINEMCKLWFDVEASNNSIISKIWLE